MRRRSIWLCVGFALALAVAACSDEGASSNGDQGADSAADVSGDLPGDMGTDAADGDLEAAADSSADAADAADAVDAADGGDVATDGSADVADDAAQDSADLGDDVAADADGGADADDGGPDLEDDAEDTGGDELLEDADAGDTTADADADADTGEPAVPLPGFGAIGGDCGILDEAIWTADTSSFLFVNELDFGDDPFDEADLSLLTPGGQEIINDGGFNAGSVNSEAFAYEVLARCELADLLATEGDVTYTDPNRPRTDVLVRLDTRTVGVSVTRAHPNDTPFDATRAQDLLEQKLQGILDQTANVTGDDVWVRQILAVVAWDDAHVTALETGYEALVDAESPLLSNTIVIITRTDGEDVPLYCSVASACPPPD